MFEVFYELRNMLQALCFLEKTILYVEAVKHAVGALLDQSDQTAMIDSLMSTNSFRIVYMI